MSSSPNPRPGPLDDENQQGQKPEQPHIANSADQLADFLESEIEDGRAFWLVMNHRDWGIYSHENRYYAAPVAVLRPSGRQHHNYNDIANAQYHLGSESFARNCATYRQLCELAVWFNWCERVGQSLVHGRHNPIVGPEGADRWRR